MTTPLLFAADEAGTAFLDAAEGRKGSARVSQARTNYEWWNGSHRIKGKRIGGSNGTASLDATREDGSTVRVVESREPSPDSHAEGIDTLRALLRALSEKERAIVARVAKGETLKTAGRALGVSESRACQLMTSARNRARAMGLGV